MKKITLLFALMCSLSIFSATYLVQLGTGATWRTLVSGETLVNLSTVGTGGTSVSFNAWFTDKSLASPVFSGTKFATGDQVWVINGTYYLTATVILKAGVAIYGGFAGTETTTDGVTGRAKVSGGNAWDFTNATILDGSIAGSPRVPSYICISGGSGTLTTLVDGLTIQNGKNTSTNGSAGGAKIDGLKTTMQNCIVTGCIGTNASNSSSSGIMLVNAGTVQDCYIHHNTSSTGASGGLTISGANCHLYRSTIASNSATNYGGLSLAAVTGDVSIDYCKFESNSATTGNAGGIGGYITNAAAQNPISITNCSFTSNTAGASGGAFYVNFSNATNGPASQVNLTSCTFTSNSAAASTSTTGGGAVILNTGTFTFDKCTFTNNYTTKSIGGAVLVSSNSATFKNSTFTGNTSGTTTTANGSAIYCITSATMNNCVVAGNTGINAIYVKAAAGVSGTFNNVTIASNVSSLAAPVGINLNAAAVASTFTNCLLYNCSATPIGYSGSFPPVVTFTGFGTDVATLPTYANPTNCINTIAAASFVNAATNDYHLAVGSTAINAGTTIAACSPDIANVTRPQSSAYDMGAYEATLKPGAPSITGITAENAQLSVAFTAGYDGISAITSYKYSIDNGATFSTRQTGTTASPIIITGLTNGTSYNVQILAVNANGDGIATGSIVGTPVSPNVSVLNGETKTPTQLGLNAASIVTVDNGGTLNINNTTEVSTVTVASGGKLNIEVGKPLTVGTLTLTSAIDGSSSTVKLDANINATIVRLFKTIDKTKWYFMSFPCNVIVANITKSNGDAKPTINGDAGELFIKYYDGAQRGTSGIGNNWKHYVGTELIANQGYIFGLSNTQPEMTLSFPLTTEILAAETANRTISVDENYGAQINNRGWNLIGQPFLSKFIANNASGDFNIYMHDGVTNTYSPYSKATIPNMNPFSAYFIQASAALASAGIVFDFSTGRQLVPSMVAAELTDEVQLDLTSSTGSDFALLRMENSLTTDYEIGHDLEKWIGTGTPKPQIYTSLSGINYAFNALPMPNVVNLPVGIYTQTAGVTTIHAVAAKAPSLSKLLLTDNSTNPATVTDLLMSDYSFTSTAGTDNSRFSITAQRVPTGNLVETEADEPSISIVNCKLSIVNMLPLTSVRIFDALGRLVANKTLINNLLEINLSTKGIYLVQIETGEKSWVKKVVY